MSFIELEHVSKTFSAIAGKDFSALDDISMNIAKGEYVCITGISGSGKSTLLNILGCLDQPTNGEYLFDGTNVRNLEKNAREDLRRRNFGFVFQSSYLLEYATLLENVELPATYTSLLSESRKKRARELIEMLGISKRYDHFPSELSGGEQQRLAVARAMMNGCQVILADEPTAALDAEQKNNVLRLFKQLVDKGYTVVTVSHDSEVAAHAKRQIVLSNGRIELDRADRSVYSSIVNEKLHELDTWESPSLFVRIQHYFSAFWMTLRFAKLRFLLSLLVIGTGISLVLGVLSVFQGVDRFGSALLAKLGADRITINSKTDSEHNPSAPFDMTDVQNIRKRVENIRDVDVLFQGVTDMRSAEAEVDQMNFTAQVGLRPRWNESIEWPIESGEFLSQIDIETRANVVVIGSLLRDILFASKDSAVIDEFIEISGIPFKVKGVMTEHPLVPGMNPWQQSAERHTAGARVFIPFTTAYDSVYPKNQGFFSIYAYISDISKIRSTVSQINDVLRERYKEDDYQVKVSADTVYAYRDVAAGGILYWKLMLMLVLLTSGGLVFAIVHTSVSERTQEIGLKKALGARNSDIFGPLAIESVILAILGGFIGFLVAQLVLSEVISIIFDVEVQWNAWFIWIALGIALGIGLIFGGLPAGKATLIDPVQALRVR